MVEKLWMDGEFKYKLTEKGIEGSKEEARIRQLNYELSEEEVETIIVLCETGA